MPDTDPPYEIDDGESPGDGDDDSPNAHASHEQISDRYQEQVHQQKSAGEANEYLQRRFQKRSEYYAANFVGDRSVIVPRPNHFVRAGIERRDRGRFLILRFQVVLSLL